MHCYKFSVCISLRNGRQREVSKSSHLFSHGLVSLCPASRVRLMTTKVSECRSVLAETITSAPEDRQKDRQTDNQEACIHRRGQRISVERTTNYTDLWVSSAYYLHSPLSPPPRTGNRVVLFCDGECKYSNENCALFFLREEGLTQRSSPKQYTGSNIEIMSIASTQ